MLDLHYCSAFERWRSIRGAFSMRFEASEDDLLSGFEVGALGEFGGGRVFLAQALDQFGVLLDAGCGDLRELARRHDVDEPDQYFLAQVD
jgi:hypothetical protein